jgi:hypothetical protein
MSHGKYESAFFSLEYIQWKTIMTVYIGMLRLSDAVIVSMCLYKQFEIIQPDE